jgi:hypothetical protein
MLDTSTSLPLCIDVILGPSMRGRSARSLTVRPGRVRVKPCRRNLFHSVPDHVPADAYCTTASGVPVGNFRRSRPKTPPLLYASRWLLVYLVPRYCIFYSSLSQRLGSVLRYDVRSLRGYLYHLSRHKPRLKLLCSESTMLTMRRVV